MDISSTWSSPARSTCCWAGEASWASGLQCHPLPCAPGLVMIWRPLRGPRLPCALGLVMMWPPQRAPALPRAPLVLFLPLVDVLVPAGRSPSRGWRLCLLLYAETVVNKLEATNLPIG